MAIRKIKRYLRIYKTLFKQSLIQSTTYRVSFFIELFVEVGYQVMFFLFFSVIFSNVKEIAGWSYYEVLFLVGMNIVTSETLLGMAYIFGLRRLPGHIKNGDIDFILLKPINSMFNLSLSKPYFTSFLGTTPGVFLMIYSLNKLGVKPSVLDVSAGIALLVCGFVIAYSISIIISSFSFILINASSLPTIAEHTLIEFKSNPHQVYTGALRIIFYFIIPVVFISSIPSSSILQGFNSTFLIAGILLASLFLTTAVLTWNKMVTFYSSASS